MAMVSPAICIRRSISVCLGVPGVFYDNISPANKERSGQTFALRQSMLDYKPNIARSNAIYHAVGVRVDRLSMFPGAILEAMWGQEGSRGGDR